jgi:hypothetical protein
MAAGDTELVDDGGAAPPGASTMDLSIRTNSSGDKLQPGHSLTGKQEHCENNPSINPCQQLSVSHG